MKNYYRIMLGKKSAYADECHRGNFIGADFGIDIDLTGKLPDNWKDFNQKFIAIYLEKHPEKSKVTAGLACGALHTIATHPHLQPPHHIPARQHLIELASLDAAVDRTGGKTSGGGELSNAPRTLISNQV